jgi:hypothetical protein
VTPSLFDLPVGLADAAPLAEILLDVCGAHPKPITDDQRGRVASRLAPVTFSRMRPHVVSLERDPVHPAACYVCVDGVDNQPLLLRVAPASTPSSGLFPKAILIGRTHLKGREVVLNAIPFGPSDRERIATFSEQVNKACQPRPAGPRPVIVVRSASPSGHFPAAFAAFRRALKNSGINQAAFGLTEGQDPTELYFATVWSAIRSGWREGYALQGVKTKSPGASPESIARIVDIPPGATADEIAELILA